MFTQVSYQLNSNRKTFRPRYKSRDNKNMTIFYKYKQVMIYHQNTKTAKIAHMVCD